MTPKTLTLFSLFLYTAMLVSAGCGSREGEISEKEDPEIDWGVEIGLDEMMALAKEGRITEIQWYVMPNVLRATASDGSFYSLRNENKGVDLRSRLVEAGIKIGEGGIGFRHVF
jgi:hypothetical protein